MGKLTLRIAAAVVLALALFWTTRAAGATAASVRRVLHTYIALNTLPSRARQPAEKSPGTKAASQGLGWPLTGPIAAGAKGGVEISAPSGALVRSASAGKVVSVPADPPGIDIVVKDGTLTLVYAHVGPSYVHKGQVVRRGEVLGEIPHFGPGTAPGLLLEARRNGKATSVLALLGSP